MPAWMLADGEYVGLGVGERVTTGLALAVTGATVGVPTAVGLEQTGEPPAFTTLTGRVECPRDVVVSGWLTLEPYLWATGSALARAVPVGRQTWRVGGVRRVDEGDDPQTIERLPDEADVDQVAAYLLDLSAAG